MKLGELIGRTARRFSAARLHYGHGTENARDEATFLVIRGLGLPFDADLNEKVDDQEIEILVQRRIRERIPAAYLLHEAWLDGVRFYVDERVIVPRSHIAFLLKDLGSPGRVLDLCTGSGCLAVLAARAFPRARITASDITPAALEVAAKNIARYRLQRRVRLLRADLFAGIAGRFDVILANPPYVTAASMRRLPPEYRHEPRPALAGGRDGLLLVKKIIRQAATRLRAGGVLVCEVGDGRRALERALPSTPFLWPLQSVFLLQRA